MMVLLPLLSLATVSARADFDTKAIDQKVSALLHQMTLREKIGQLVQFSNGQATGPDNVHVDQKQLIAQGGMGSILNAIGAKNTNSLQQIAVEKSRLKVPLLFGLDVIHGYKTIFPVPLGMSASWDTDLVQRSARVAAVVNFLSMLVGTLTRRRF
ncbi:MAG: hypothetical protein JST51_10355 [Armatimonadetes bacterium]|nr:hypothetical protein [Armatimonadota bacterium]